MSLGQTLLPCLHAGCSGAVDPHRLSPTKGAKCRGEGYEPKHGHVHYRNEDHTAYRNKCSDPWTPLPLDSTATLEAPSAAMVANPETLTPVIVSEAASVPSDSSTEKSSLSLPPAPPRGVDVPMFLKSGKPNMQMVQGLEPSIERSLALTVAIYQNLAKLDITAQVLYLEHFIVEHAERRLDAFFALLLAYDGSGMKLEVTGPLDQKAHGNKALRLEAAHDSIIAGITDIDIEGDSPMKLRSGKKVPGRTCSKLDLYSSVLSATIELPACVNDFDNMLEGKIGSPSLLRKEAMAILNQVSQGRYSPIEGMRLFLIQFHQTLLALQKSYIKELTAYSPSAARELIWNYTYKGSLRDKLVVATKFLVPEYQEFLEAQYESHKKDLAPKTALAFMAAIEKKSIAAASASTYSKEAEKK